MAQYDAVLFDFDGVLVDSEPVHHRCWQDILAPFGIELDWQTYNEHCVGVADGAMLSLFCSRASPPLAHERLLAEYPRKKEMFRARMETIGMAQDVVRLVRALNANYRVGVVTSSDIREVGPLLENAGLMPYIDTVVHGGEVQQHKPAPDPYLLALERLRVTNAIAVEDSTAGIAAARAAGLDVIAIRSAGEVCSRVREALQL